METKPKRIRTTKQPVSETAILTKRDFGIIAKQFDTETDEVKNTMIAISEMLQHIKLNIGEQPLVIIYLVKKAIPELGELGIIGNLQLGCKKLSGETLPEVLTALRGRVTDVSDDEYNAFWHRMAINIAAPLLPFYKVVLYSEYVYQTLVKGIVK